MAEQCRVTIAFTPRETFSPTQRSLETLYSRTAEPFELVCIDGGSPADCREYLEAASRTFGFTLIRSDRFLTPNEARNLALQHVETDYVVFMENDVLVAEGWLEALLRCADETGAWAVGPLCFEFEPERTRIHMAGGYASLTRLEGGKQTLSERHRCQHQLLSEIEQPLEREETELLEFHTMMVRMAAFEQLGPLDTGLACANEHTDFCIRIRDAGEKVYLEPASAVTYTPPTRLRGGDRDFFAWRWSEALLKHTTRRMIEKYDLAPDDSSISELVAWQRKHRSLRLAWKKPLLSALPRSLARVCDQALITPAEVLHSRLSHGDFQTASKTPVS